MLLSRDAILGAQDLKTEDVPVPEWGGTVRVRMMSGIERDAFSNSLLGSEGKTDLTNYRAKLVAASIVDESGAREFSESDVQALGGKSASALERVFVVADRLNTMGAAAVDTAEKNSLPTPSDASSTGSPAT